MIRLPLFATFPALTKAFVAGIVAVLLVGPAAAAKKPPPKAWTVAQAKRALYDARRIEAHDDLSRNYGFSYFLEVVKVERMLPVGRSFAVSAQIGLLQELPDVWYGGAFDETPSRAWFCMRPRGSSWRLTGFDVRLPFFGGAKVPKAVCSPNRKRMARSVGPIG